MNNTEMWMLPNHACTPTNLYCIPVRCIKGDGITTMPVVGPAAVENVNSDYATAWLDVYADGGSRLTNVGVCWNTTGEPTVSDNTATDTASRACRHIVHLFDLAPNTTYYVRAFAANANGTTYGDSVFTFTTPSVMGRPCPDAETVTDFDGNVYRTVQIGEQCWLRENMRTTHYANGREIFTSNAPDYMPRYMRSNVVDGGLVYPYLTAVNGNPYINQTVYQGVCPQGWHVASYSEFQTMIETLGGYEAALPMLKATSTWNTPGNDASGFHAVDAGCFELGYWNPAQMILTFSDIAYKMVFTDSEFAPRGENGEWSSVRCVRGEGSMAKPIPQIIAVDSITSTTAVIRGALAYDGGDDNAVIAVVDFANNSNVYHQTSELPADGSYVVKLENLTPETHYALTLLARNEVGEYVSLDSLCFTTLPVPVNMSCPEQPYVSDMDGNIYNTVKIGNQCWMKENLRTTLFADGTEIMPYGSNSNYLYMSPRVQGYTPNRFGLYYSIETATKGAPEQHSEPVQGVCPQGWHLPSVAEWQTLLETAEGLGIAAEILTEPSSFWYDGETHTNTTGFSARPTGYTTAYDTSSIQMFGWQPYFATSDYDSEYDGYAALYYSRNYWEFNYMQVTDFLPVRCIRGEGATAFAPSVELIMSAITPYEIQELGMNISPNDHDVMWETEQLYFGTSPDDLEPLTGESPYWNWGQGGWAALRNLDPGTTYYVQGCFMYDDTEMMCSEIGSFETPTIGYPNCPDVPTVTDVDGNTYQTIQIGNQCWMRENLRTTHFADNTPIYHAQTSPDTSTTEFFYYSPNLDDSYIPTYGCLYNAAAATHGLPSNAYMTHMITTQGVCPDGWHLPSRSEWQTLIEEVGLYEYYTCNWNNMNVARALCSTEGWRESESECAVGYSQSQNNATGFGVMPAGREYTNFGRVAHYWTADNYEERWQTCYSFMYNDPTVDDGTNLLYAGQSVRCIFGEGEFISDQPGYIPGDDPNQPGGDSTNTSSFDCGSTLYDIDQNAYATTQVGTQCWMAENLRTTRYASGAPITYSMNLSSNTPYYTYPNNDFQNKNTYGLLYNWPAVMHTSQSSNANPSGVQGICPDGWHVPSDAEWMQMELALGMEQVDVESTMDRGNISVALAGTTGWIANDGNTPGNPSAAGRNASGMNIIPAGKSVGDDSQLFGERATFYTTTKENGSVWFRSLAYNDLGFTRDYTVNSYINFSVRCVADGTF